jgi:hypothetical protein
MPPVDVEALLVMLRDPNCETQEIANVAGVPREEAGRACRLVMGIAKAKPEEAVKLPAPLAMAVLHAAAAAGRAEVLAALAAHPSKDVAKEGKRALYLMKTRGVSVPELPRVAIAPPPQPTEAPVPCYASALDGHGERAVWIGRSIPGKGIEVGQAVLSDQQGITEFHLGMLGRKEYRAFGKELLQRGHGMGVAEVDRDFATALVAAARALNGTAGQASPPGTDAWLDRLGPASPLADPAVRFPALPEEEERAAVQSSGRLHELPLVKGWLADEDALRALALKLDEIAVSSLYLDERQRSEASARAVTDALAGHFDEQRRTLWAARLFALADHLQRARDEESARLAAAAARALRGGVAVEQMPFARLLVEKAFPPRPVAREAAPRPDEPSLLVTPPR